MSVYKIFILLVFQREYAKSNVMISFRILSSFDYIVFMLLLKLPNRNTHVCTSSIRMISFFLPFSVNCSQVAMFQVMLALCLHGQGEGVWSTKCGQAWTVGGKSSKPPNLCGHPLCMTPCQDDKR